MLRAGIHHQQNAQLQKLLTDNGYPGDLPSSFYASIPAGSDLLRWLVTGLTSSNFVSPADVTLAAEFCQSRQALSQDRLDLLTDQRQLDGFEGKDRGTEWLESQVSEYCLTLLSANVTKWAFC